MAIVIHHPVKTVDNEITRWVDPVWADHGYLQAYRVGAFADPSIDVPDGGAAFYQVHADNLSLALSDGATLFADNLTDNSLNKVGRSAIEHYWGKQTPSDVTSPADAIIRIVGRDAHPDGVLGPRPIMPGSDGRFRWVFAVIKDPKRSLAISELPQLVTPQKFQPALDRDSSHFASRSHVRDVQLESVGKLMDSGDFETGRKVAGFNGLKWGLKPSELADFSSELIPSRHSGEKAQPPETRIEIPFTTLTGFTAYGAWSIVSGQAEEDTPGANAHVGLRWDTALSGPDQQARVDITWENVGSSYAGPACRWDSAAFTFYTMIGSAVSTSDGLFRFDAIASVATLLSVAYAVTASTRSCLVKADGSVIYGEISTDYALAITDTTYGGDMNFGVMGRAQTSGLNHAFDNLVGEDIITTPRGRRRMKYYGIG